MRRSAAHDDAQPPSGAAALRLVPRPKLRVADVVLLRGEPRRDIDSYLEAKAACGLFDHHVLTPEGVRARRALKHELHRLAPDVVVMHGALRAPMAVIKAAQKSAARVVGGRGEEVPLRFGLHDAFHPRPDVARTDEVLYVGRLAREKGVLELLEAAARARDRWPLRFAGSGPLEKTLRRAARRLRIADRVSFQPFIGDHDELGELYAAASVVVLPGRREPFGLVGLEAAACGAPVVCCETAPSAPLLGELAHTFPARSRIGLAAAIFRGRVAERDLTAAWRLVERYAWDSALAAEEDALRALLAVRQR